MDPIDMRLICRLCAKEDKFCIDVFGVDGSKNNISKKIRLCLPITIKEDDDYPKQICLSCLNKLDTSYELYSGCMSAQHTIKKLLRMVTHIQSSSDDLRIESPIEQTNLIAQQQSNLSQSRPMMKIGKTVVKLQDVNSGKSTEPKSKIRRLESESDDDSLNMALEDDSNHVCSPLNSVPLDDEDGNDNSTDNKENSQQVPQIVLQARNLSGYTVATSDQGSMMCLDATSISQQQFGTSGTVSMTSSNRQLVGEIPKSTTSQFFSAVQPVPNPVIQTVSTSSEGILTNTMNGLNSTSNRFAISSSSINPTASFMVQQNPIVQPQVYIPNSVYSSPSVEQQVSTVNCLARSNTTENQASSLTPILHSVLHGKVQPQQNQLHRQVIKPQQPNQQVQTRQLTSLEGVEVTVPAFVTTPAGALRPKSGESVFKPNILTYKGPQNKVTPISSVQTLSLIQQKKQQSVDMSPILQGKFKNSGITLPPVPEGSLKNSVRQTSGIHPSIYMTKPRSTATVSPLTRAKAQQMYVAGTIANRSVVDATQQLVNLENRHLSESGHPPSCLCSICQQARGASDNTTVPITAVTTAISNPNTMTVNSSARISNTAVGISLGTPIATPMVGVEMSTSATNIASVGATPIISVGVPTLTSLGILTPISTSTLNMLTTVSSSPVSMVTPNTTSAVNTVSAVVTPAVSTVTPVSTSTNSTGTLNATSEVVEQVFDVPIDVEEFHISDDSSDNTLPFDTTTTTATNVEIKNTSNNSSVEVNSAKRKNLCQYCNKYFPENIIVHHRTLHFRERFFCCIACGKNFRTEIGLEHHRCEDKAN